MINASDGKAGILPCRPIKERDITAVVLEDLDVMLLYIAASAECVYFLICLLFDVSPVAVATVQKTILKRD